MAFRFRFRQQIPEIPVPAPEPAAPSPRPSVAARLLGPLQLAGGYFHRALGLLDEGFVALAVPFGVRVSDPRRRYAVMLGAFAVLFLLGALPIPIVPLVALAVGYLGVLAIGRAWAVNEKERAAIVKKLKDADPDQMPDLRATALVAGLQLFLLFPLLFQQVQWHFHLYQVHDGATFGSWLWFALDKTYLKALPDWSVLYGVHVSSIEFDSTWGKHLVLLSRLTFDYILIQGLLRLLAIRATIREGVAAVKADPEQAVRLGRRAIPALVEKLKDPDKGVRGGAANALTQLGAGHALRRLVEGLPEESGSHGH